MTTVQTTTSTSTTPSANTTLANSASPPPHPLLSSDFAYLNWAISKLEVMTTSPLDDEARRLLSTISDASLDDLIRTDAIIKFTKTAQEDLSCDNDSAKQNVILAPTISKATQTLVTTLNDDSQEVRLESFVALTHLMILKKKHEDSVFMKELRDREKVARCDRGPLSVLDGCMVFELAMDVLLSVKETSDADVEHFFQAFKEFCSTGRKFIISTHSA